MKRVIAACFVGALIFSGTTFAATPTQRIAKLEKQVKTLTATVKKQQAVINCVVKVSGKCQPLKTTANTLRGAVNAAIAVEFCAIAATSDAFQGTWTTLDQAAGTTLFGPQQAISDANLCSLLQITRQGIRIPPTTSVFSALTSLLSRTSAFRLG